MSGTVENIMAEAINLMWAPKKLSVRDIEHTLDRIRNQLDVVPSIEALNFKREVKMSFRGFSFVAVAKTPEDEARMRIWCGIKETAVQQKLIPGLLFENDICTKQWKESDDWVEFEEGLLESVREARARANQMVDDAGEQGKQRIS